MATRAVLLILLGFLWSVRLSSMKAAGLSGVPVHVVVSVAALGIALFFTVLAAARRDWPPMDRGAIGFYGLTGLLGFLVPFALEGAVAPHLPVFVFVVLISTMPLMTLVLSVMVGGERFRLIPALSVGLGFVGALIIVWDTTRAGPTSSADIWWVVAALGVPLLYAINTVFVATRWPKRCGAIHVAHAQALIVSVAAFLGSLAAGALPDWSLAARNAPAIGLIVVGEGLALLVYLRVTRDYGATYVSLGNYVAMMFAAVLGAVWFEDQLSALTIVAAILVVAAVSLHQRQGQAP